MFQILAFPFRLIGSLLNMVWSLLGSVFSFVGGIVGLAFGLAGGILRLVVGGVFTVAVVVGIIFLIRWFVRGVRGV